MPLPSGSLGFCFLMSSGPSFYPPSSSRAPGWAPGVSGQGWPTGGVGTETDSFSVVRGVFARTKGEQG